MADIVVMASSLPNSKILVVDDNPVILKVLSLALEPRGYQVFTAIDGPEAFNIVNWQEPDLILLDIFFPPDASLTGNTWDAFQIMHWLQRMGGPQAHNIPVVVMSGADPEEFKDRCLAAGAVDYIHKPITIPDLLEIIQRIFHPQVSGDVPPERPAAPNSERLHS
jgi:CheY-like chemotaxis protein